MTAFAADVDFVQFGIIVDVHVTGGVVNSPYEILPCRLVLVPLPARQMTTGAHCLHGIRIDRRSRQHIISRSVAAVSAGGPPHVKLVVVPDAPLSVQPVVTSGHVVTQQGVPSEPISQSRRNRDDVALVVNGPAIE